ncbi:MAG: polysaccharide deacetylase family protein [candidate division KSB1 bacterium]|nr:polysaccharide deacetylase family protein [candidate division KSB1 bacterium]MDZ7358215.1 polysaccharide deacetylase family protein [candidate division KSB1 bacterium]MDZ7399645.1 polysaccharide deacetylase family protein [candidate division KSB1 bacterium]
MTDSNQQNQQKKLPCIVTTSWDDGSVLDLKLANLLDKYNSKGTFYIPQSCINHGFSIGNLKEISNCHEIGAHGVSHRDLTKLLPQEAIHEIKESKHFLEGILKNEIAMFAYPYGSYNNLIKSHVKDCGYLGARTINPFRFELAFDAFEMGVTMHIALFYSFIFRKLGNLKEKILNSYNEQLSLEDNIVIKQPQVKDYLKLFRIGLPLLSFVDNKKLIMNIFKRILTTGGIFHLWGHSWEIEQFKMWKSLELIFEYISKRPEVKYLTNSGCLEM